MLTSKSIMAYRKQFPEDSCAFAEPSSLILVENNGTGMLFISPLDETDEVFLSRLERCQKDNHNYFYDEWKEFHPEAGMLY